MNEYASAQRRLCFAVQNRFGDGDSMSERPSGEALSAVRRVLDRTLEPSRIRDDPTELEKYASDWSGAPPVLPDLVVKPRSTEEVASILRAANQARVPVTPRGLGSGKAGGSIPIYGGIVLSLEGLNNIEHVDRANMTAVVGAGTILADVWRATEAEKLFYPPDPNSFDICSIGGNIACNAGGPRALKYGVTKNYVLGVEVVLPTGDIIDAGKATLKHVTGYDLTSLVVGSEGTLGVITKATLRLLPEPASIETGVLHFANVHTAARVLTQLLADGHQPRTLELLDHHALDALRQKSPNLFPDTIGALVIAETDGTSDERAFADLQQLAEAALAYGALDVQVAQNEADRRRIWLPRNTLSESLRATAEAKISEDIVVPRSHIPDMIDAAQRISDRHGVKVATYGHAGDGNLHVNILFDRDQRAAADGAVLDVLKAAISFGGTLSGEHGLGMMKRDFLGLEHSEHKIELQRTIKKSLDPNGILNPGKVLPRRAISSPQVEAK